MANLERVAQINKTIATQGAAAPSAGSSSSGGAVNLQGQIVGSNGQVTGMANPADRYSPSATKAEGPTEAPPTAPGPINPAQASTATAPVSRNQAVEHLKSLGYVNSDEQKVQSAMQDLSPSQPKPNKFQTTFAQGAPKGVDLNDPGLARGAVSNSLPKDQELESPSLLGGVMETDNNFDSIFTSYDKFFSPPAQKQTLLQEYTQLQKSLGINTMNADLIDAKRIINGTEDDIRLEVEKAGGFATESQVQGLANARNKSLIRNYNYLLESRDSAMTQLNTMMNFSAQDRKSATDEFDRKMNFAFKVADYTDKARNNAREGFNNIVKNVGYDGLLNSLGNNPSAVARVEKTLGLNPGGLTELATTPKKKDYGFTSMDGVLYRTDSVTGTATPVVGNSSASGPVKTPLINKDTGKPDPRSQLAGVIKETGAKTDDKLKLTGSVISAVQDLAGNSLEGSFEGLGLGSLVPSRLNSDKGQLNRTYLSALEGTVEAWMTGASVSDDQQKRIKSTMVPKSTDSDGQVKRKLNALANYMLSYAAGSLSSQGVDWTPTAVDFFNNPLVTAPDGEEIEITN